MELAFDKMHILLSGSMNILPISMNNQKNDNKCMRLMIWKRYDELKIRLKRYIYIYIYIYLD